MKEKKVDNTTNQPATHAHTLVVYHKIINTEHTGFNQRPLATLIDNSLFDCYSRSMRAFQRQLKPSASNPY